MKIRLQVIKAVVIVLVGLVARYLIGYLYQAYLINNNSVAQLKNISDFPLTTLINILNTVILWTCLISAGFIIGKSISRK
jgi:biotin transporter BioY